MVGATQTDPVFVQKLDCVFYHYDVMILSCSLHQDAFHVFITPKINLTSVFPCQL